MEYEEKSDYIKLCESWILYHSTKKEILEKRKKENINLRQKVKNL